MLDPNAPATSWPVPTTASRSAPPTRLPPTHRMRPRAGEALASALPPAHTNQQARSVTWPRLADSPVPHTIRSCSNASAPGRRPRPLTSDPSSSSSGRMVEMAGPHARNSPRKSRQVRNGCLPDITGGRVSGLAWRSRAAEWSCPECIGRAEAAASVEPGPWVAA